MYTDSFIQLGIHLVITARPMYWGYSSIQVQVDDSLKAPFQEYCTFCCYVDKEKGY